MPDEYLVQTSDSSADGHAFNAERHSFDSLDEARAFVRKLIGPLSSDQFIAPPIGDEEDGLITVEGWNVSMDEMCDFYVIYRREDA